MGLLSYIMGEEPGLLEKAAFILKNGGDTGAYGEYLTKYMFGSVRFKGYYKTLSNIYVPYRGKTSEIDILLIHENGLYVIESKNYSGWIFGSEEQLKWTQVLNKNNKNRFYNPIKQNKTHINALSNYLKEDKTQFESFIVFSERCELKKVPENTKEYTITKRNNLIKLINSKIEEKNNSTYKYTKEEINEIYDALYPLTQVSEKEKQDHIEMINKNNNK